jgi:hypothetical protein
MSIGEVFGVNRVRLHYSISIYNMRRSSKKIKIKIISGFSLGMDLSNQT